jgi:hypothetical protein
MWKREGEETRDSEWERGKTREGESIRDRVSDR